MKWHIWSERGHFKAIIHKFQSGISFYHISYQTEWMAILFLCLFSSDQIHFYSPISQITICLRGLKVLVTCSAQVKYPFLLPPSWSGFCGWQHQPISQSNTLIQIEKSQHLLGISPWTFVQTFMFSRGWSLCLNASCVDDWSCHCFVSMLISLHSLCRHCVSKASQGEFPYTFLNKKSITSCYS